MKVHRWILLTISAVLAALFELSFISFLPEPWRGFRPILDVVVLCVILGRPRAAMVFGAVAGATLDLFPIDGMTAASLRLVLIAAVLALVAETVLTNRSIYATGVLIFAARMLDHGWLFAGSVVSRVVSSGTISIEPIGSVLITVAWDVVVLSVIFIAIAQFTRRFMIAPVIDRRRYG